MYDERYLAHSSGVWKKHKYTRKEGNRYYYDKNHNIADDAVGIETPDLEGAANELGKIEPIGKMRDAMNITIWSPNPEEETLITKGSDAIKKLFGKDEEKMMAKK